MHPTLRLDLAATIIADRHPRCRARRAAQPPLPAAGFDPAPR